MSLFKDCKQMSWLSRIFGLSTLSKDVSNILVSQKESDVNSISNIQKPSIVEQPLKGQSLLTADLQYNGIVNTEKESPKIVPYIDPKGCSQEEILSYLKSSPAPITFVHGKAGCGKTYLLQKFEKDVPGCQILTPTNLACKLYRNATTMHSFFYGAFDDLDEGYQNPNNISLKVHTSRAAIYIKSVKILVIDEISMVRADTFEMMNCIFQKILGNPKPFGGIPIVVVGDLFQLPPIVSDKAIEQYLEKEYGGIYFFHSHVIQNNIQSVKLFELTKSFRQLNDPAYADILDSFRKPMNAQKKVEILKVLNTRVVSTIPPDVIRIASSNEEVRNVNHEQLSHLAGNLENSVAQISVAKLSNRQEHVTFSYEDIDSQEDIFPIEIPSNYEPVFELLLSAKP